MTEAQTHGNTDKPELTVTVVGTVTIVMSVVVVVFRFCTRFHLKAILWWDDWMALAAVVSAVAAGAFVLAGKWVAMIYTHLMETSICPGGC